MKRKFKTQNPILASFAVAYDVEKEQGRNAGRAAFYRHLLNSVSGRHHKEVMALDYDAMMEEAKKCIAQCGTDNFAHANLRASLSAAFTEPFTAEVEHKGITLSDGCEQTVTLMRSENGAAFATLCGVGKSSDQKYLDIAAKESAAIMLDYITPKEAAQGRIRATIDKIAKVLTTGKYKNVPFNAENMELLCDILANLVSAEFYMSGHNPNDTTANAVLDSIIGGGAGDPKENNERPTLTDEEKAALKEAAEHPELLLMAMLAAAIGGGFNPNK